MEQLQMICALGMILAIFTGSQWLKAYLKRLV